MRELELKVTIDEANLILEGLGNLPFARVFELIGKIQQQASGQLNGGDAVKVARSESDASPATIEEGTGDGE